MVALTTRQALDAWYEERNENAAFVEVYGQFTRKRLLSRGLIFGDILLQDKSLLNIMIQSKEGWLTKDQVVQLKFDMHLGDIVRATGKLEKTAANELLFVLFSCVVEQKWDDMHPGEPFTSTLDPTTFFTSANDKGSQTNMVQIQGFNACKYYFNNASCVRGNDCQFWHGKPEDYDVLRKEWLEKRLQQKRIVSSIEGDEHDPNEKKLKSARARIFCEWLVEKFGEDKLRCGSGVIDVAGGRGDISFELWNKRAIPATLVEPRPRKPRKEHFKYLNQNNGATLAPQIQACFDDQTVALNESTFTQCSMVVGMHPDEATEAIVDMSLALNKPFAVVPCCVMSRLFPDRMFEGERVATYEAFVRYLQAKHPAIQSTFLPFAGKNQVLFMME